MTLLHYVKPSTTQEVLCCQRGCDGGALECLVCSCLLLTAHLLGSFSLAWLAVAAMHWQPCVLVAAS
jgi:hypothetical protein